MLVQRIEPEHSATTSPSIWISMHEAPLPKCCKSFLLLALIWTPQVLIFFLASPIAMTLIIISEPLDILVVFSEPAYIPLPTGYSLLGYITAFKTVYLNGATTGPILPIAASFDASSTQLSLKFQGFSDGQALNLVFNLTAFLTVSSDSAFAAGALGVGHNYGIH